MSNGVLTIDTTPDSGSPTNSSRARLQLLVANVLATPDELRNIKSLVLCGCWKLRAPESLELPELDLYRSRADSVSSASDTRMQPEGSITPPEEWEITTEKDWAKGIQTLKNLMERLTNLERLT